ncbi:MAG: ATP-binding protein, partial [Terriglobales bacterium]
FQSNFEGGTGLGLAIVYQIVQAHEGKVWARSEVGKGTSFVVRLRRMDAATAIGTSSRPDTAAAPTSAAALATAAAATAEGGVRG